jgi:hypothetical protein
VHRTAETEVAPDTASAPAAAAASVRGARGAVLALQRTAGNRATGAALALARAPTTNVLPFDEDIFRAKGGAEVVTGGQFVFSSHLFDILVPKVKKQVDAAPRFREKLNEHMTACGHNDEGYINWAEADKARADLKAAGFPADVLGPEAASLAAGGAIFEKLWAGYADPKSSFPDLTPYATISQYQALRRWEYQACKATALKVAKRYVAAGGVGGKRKAETAIKPTALVGGVKTDTKLLASGLALGTVATYSAALGEDVARMKRALDDGWVVHARVLSGLEGGGASRAEAEHSLVVFGYDGDAFEFFDPDVSGSNVKRSGFDKLYFDRSANRLSTAQTEADFAVYAAGGDYSTGKVHGWQARGVHRYQVTSIETV